MAFVGDEGPLTDAQVKSHADGRALIVRQLAGRARMLTELASGASAISGERATTASNPQGLIGCDLSGPPWGSAIRNVIAHWSGIKAAANIQQPTQPLTVLCAGGIATTTVMRWRLWNRPYESLGQGGVAPHSRGLVAIRAHNSDASTPTLSVSARNATLGQGFGEGQGPATKTISGGATETAYDYGTGFWVDLAPGWNNVELLFTHATSGDTVTIDSVCLYQWAKRSH